MPRARLTAGSWRFESDRLDAIRAKMAAGRPTLAEVYGAPLCGVKTGLNEAFVLSRDQRDVLIAQDHRSAELLKPFLVGENLKRWHVESDDLWLIYTPKNRVDIDAYPAVRDYLLPYKERLERRATKQEWWELQQAQGAYEPAFGKSKVIWPEFSQGPKFSFDTAGTFPLNKVYFVPDARPRLVAQLGSKPSWFYLFGEAGSLRGGQWRLITGEAALSRVPLSSSSDGEQLDVLATDIQDLCLELAGLVDSVVHRLADLDPRVGVTSAFRAWPDLSFADLRALIAKRFRGLDFKVAERSEWETWFEGERVKAAALRARIADAENEINARVYALFGLDRDEVAAIEETLAGQY